MICRKDIAIAPRVVETAEDRERRKRSYVESNRLALARLAATPAVKGERRLAWAHNPRGADPQMIERRCP